METVVPIASNHSLAIEPSEALAEGAAFDLVLELIHEHEDDGAILCSHGDIIPTVLQYLHECGVDLGLSPKCEKGSTWMIEGRIGPTAVATYWPPPNIT